jgi:hypothetical protein
MRQYTALQQGGPRKTLCLSGLQAPFTCSAQAFVFAAVMVCTVTRSAGNARHDGSAKAACRIANAIVKITEFRRLSEQK